MGEQDFMKCIEKYLWKHLLWAQNHGYHNSGKTFGQLYDTVHQSITHAVRWPNCKDLGVDPKSREKEARRRLSLYDSEVRGLIEAMMLKMDRKKSKEAINEISAKVMLEPLLDGSGFKYYIEYLKTGVKLNVQLLPKKKAQLYMSYSDVRRNSGELVNKIVTLKQMYDYFGVNSGIVNITKDETDKFISHEDAV